MKIIKKNQQNITNKELIAIKNTNVLIFITLFT